MKVSIIVPVRDEENSIRELIEGLLAQTRPPDEIVITDGGSVDSTAQIIEEYISRGAPIRLIRAGVALPGRARNLGAAAAQFSWLGFTDAGIRPAKDWLEVLVRRAEQDEAIDVVYGATSPITDTFFKECAAIAYCPATWAQLDSVKARFIASALLRRSAWEAVKGFPEHLRSAEDLVFMNKVDEAGFRSVQEPAAIVHWHLRPTLGSTYKRFVVYARNNIRAGLWRQWQAPIMTRYLALLLVLILLIRIDVKWTWIPFVLWLAMLTARATVAIRRNRFIYPASLHRNIKRTLLLIPILAVLDAATIVGSIHWLCLDWLRWSPKTTEIGNGA